MSDGWHEECGVFGIHGHPEASNMTYLGLYALQHRGQESAGIASTAGEGTIFQCSMDTEVIGHLSARSRKERIEDRIVDALNQVRGAYSLLFMTRDKLIGVRDPHGIRPLALGKLKGDGGTVICSESCALDLIEAQYLREVEPGEMIVGDERGVPPPRPFLPAVERFCIFEYVYFARPDSIMGGASIYEVRKALGRPLAMEGPANAAVVIPVPASGVPAA